MSMDEAQVLLVMTTLPDAAAAQAIARELVERRLAACVSIQSSCRSVYRWQGAVEASEEVPVLIKTTSGRYPELQATLQALHPYTLPEIIAWPVVQGLPGYLDWVRSEAIPEDPGSNDRLTPVVQE
jgi:periplasmic divalent cation tolerance protein